MTDILLLVAIIPFFLAGFFIMKKVDRFVFENEKMIREEIKLKKPSSVRLSGSMSLIEIDKEIEKFRKSHPNFEIILRDEDMSGYDE